MDKKSIVITIILFIVCFPIGIIYLIYTLANNGIKKDHETSIQNMEREREKEKEDYEAMVSKLCVGHTTPDKVIMIGWCKDALIIFDKEKKFIIGQKEYGYDDLISFKIIEKRFTSGGGQVVETKTSLKSVAGRSVVGALVAGPAGALIGGATAKRTSTVTDTSTEEVYYDIEVKLRDLTNPVVTIECYSKDEAVDIDGVLSYISSSRES